MVISNIRIPIIVFFVFALCLAPFQMIVDNPTEISTEGIQLSSISQADDFRLQETVQRIIIGNEPAFPIEVLVHFDD